MSRLYAMAFSAVCSTLWTLGPVSEASLGNVQLHSSPGFVDLVVTPTMGTGWAIGEDAVDRYLIAKLEQRTANRALLLIARSFGNPTRTFARMMALQIPWKRDAARLVRSGIHREIGEDSHAEGARRRRRLACLWIYVEHPQ